MKNDLQRKVINVDKSNLIPLWTVKELDDCILKLSLFKNNVAFDVTGQTLSLGAKTPIGLQEQSSGITFNSNEVDIQLKNSIVAKKGIVEIDLNIKDASGSMTTASFFIVVGEKVLNDAGVEASEQFDSLTQIKKECEEVLQNGGAINIVDNLTSTSTTSALSAKQGKVLNDYISDMVIAYSDESISVEFPSLINDINTIRDQYNTIAEKQDELFQSVSNGKSLIASAITDKGVPTLANATFNEMASNIRTITTGEETGETIDETNLANLKTGNLTLSDTVSFTNATQSSVNVTSDAKEWSNFILKIDNLIPNSIYRLSYNFNVFSGKTMMDVGVTGARFGQTEWKDGVGSFSIDVNIGDYNYMNVYVYLIDGIAVESNINITNFRIEFIETITPIVDETPEYKNIIYIDDYPRNSNETDDSPRINRAINDLTSDSKLIFGKGATYTCSSQILIKDKNNIELDGNGCIINSNFNSGNLMYCTTTKYYDNQSASFKIAEGQYSFSLSISGASIGDILEFRDVSKTWDTNQAYSCWGRITDVTSNNITIEKEHKSRFAFTSNMIRLYKTSDSITIKNFTMNSNSSQITLKIENNINSLITNLNLYGDGGACGIWYTRNINTDTTNCNIDYYNDRTTSNGSSGYGINLYGYNCTANGNIMKRCGGNTTNGYGVGLVYKNNTVYEADSSYPFMAALLSSHAMSDVSFLNNTLYVYDDIKVFSSRAWKQTIKDNLIITPDTFSSTVGTYLCHLHCDIYTPTDGIEFTGNEIIGSVYTKYSKTIQIELNDDKNNGTVNISNNKLNGIINIQGKGRPDTGYISEVYVKNNHYTDTLTITESGIVIKYKEIVPNYKDSSDNSDTNIVSIASFPRNSGETDDSPRITRAINSLSNGETLKFESGTTYTLNSAINIVGVDNFTIDGSNSIFNSTIDSYSDLFSLKATTVYNLTQSTEILENQSEFTISNISNATVGDILYFFNTKNGTQYNDNLTENVMGEITNIDGNKYTISHPSRYSFTADRVYVYKTLQNINIKNIKFNMLKGNIGMELQHCKNCIIENCTFNGTEGATAEESSAIGILMLRCIDSIVKNCSANNCYYEVTGNSLGYGVCVGGHNLVVESCNIENCKHAIASRGYSVNITYRNNIVRGYSRGLQIIDSHEKTQVLIEGNTIYQNDTYRDAMKLRGWQNTVINNTIICSSSEGGYSTSKGRIITVEATDHIKKSDGTLFEGNEIIGNLNNYNYLGYFRVNKLYGCSNIYIKNNINIPNIINVWQVENVSGDGILDGIYVTGNSSSEAIVVNSNVTINNKVISDNTIG